MENTKTAKLVLIDGNAIIHRAYHAIPKSFKTRSGEQTNVVYGFATTMIKVLEDLHPEYVAATFDLPGGTFRHEHYEQYKATRIKADQELYDQIPRVKQLMETMGIPIYEKEGFEADDCLGTIVDKNKTDNNLTIYIVSGDKDVFQLVNGNVKVYNLKKGLSQTQIVDSDTITQDYGLTPHAFIDLKALAGDSSDNIPGVPGIGPKTATDLIQKFTSLENLYLKLSEELDKAGILSKSEFPISKKVYGGEANDLTGFSGGWKTQIESRRSDFDDIAEQLLIKPRILELLVIHKDQAYLSHHLATIHKDVPIDFMLEDCKYGAYDREKLKDLFAELGFSSLLRRFGVLPEETGRKSTEAQKTKDEQLKLL